MAALIALLRELDEERLPEDPPIAPEGYRSQIGLAPPGMEAWLGVVRDGGNAVVGYTRLLFPRDEDQDAAYLFLGVSRSARRHGIGRRLLDAAIAQARTRARVRVMSMSVDRVMAGESFARSVGARLTQSTTTGQLDVSEMPTTALTAELAQRGAAASAYDLRWVDTPCPTELGTVVCDVYAAIDDAPHGSSSIETVRYTLDRIRARQQFLAEAGRPLWTVITIHRATGSGAGFSELAPVPGSSAVMRSYGTAVRREHRGHDLARWMKLALLERVRRERPAVRYLRTDNAEDNAPMLHINQSVGYHPAWRTFHWELDIPPRP